ncbi:hypothetical protein NMY22_g18786 [Coprinellus aureogranulatus]|nr:hypothetical protein NMY22_g18786 [Coprinellus aureogranulatus]
MAQLVERTGIVDLPSEILSNIFSTVAAVPFTFPTFPSASTAAAQDLLSLTHVNTRFREASVQDPRLWTTIPPVNYLNPDYLEIMLHRSRLLPFSLAMLEGEDLPLDSYIWEMVVAEKRRIGLLYVEVDEEYGGTFSRGFLTSAASSLKRCIVAFHGQRNVCLKFDGAPGRHPLPFGGSAPQLASLELVNCYIPPQYFNFPNSLSSISVHSCTSPSNGHMGMPDGLCIWEGKWQCLRTLKLVNCFYHARLDDLPSVDKLELRYLETLTLSLPYHVCKILADRLAVPNRCSRAITALFPPRVDLEDARAAVVAVGSLVPEAQFHRSRFSLELAQPSVILHREVGGDVTVLLDLQHSAVLLPNASQPYTRAPVDHFCLALWSSFRVRAASFSPPTIYTSKTFRYIFTNALPQLRRLMLTLEDHSQQTLSGLASLVTQRNLCGRRIEDIVLSFSLPFLFHSAPIRMLLNLFSPDLSGTSRRR